MLTAQNTVVTILPIISQNRIFTALPVSLFLFPSFFFLSACFVLETLTDDASGWCRFRGCLIFTGHFPPKSPLISGSFAENDRQLEASSESWPPCTARDILVTILPIIFA